MSSPSDKRKHILRAMIAIIVILIFISVSLISYMQKEAGSIEVTEVIIDDLPCKIVFFSDMHATRNNIDFLNNAALIINEQKPDLVLIGGDFIHSRYSEIFLQDYLLQIEAPKFGVFGNHDDYAFYDNQTTNLLSSIFEEQDKKYNEKSKKKDISEEFIFELEKRDVKILRNEYEILPINNKTITIFGFDIREKNNFTGPPCNESCFNILLMHEPRYDIKTDYDLILAGHTHGGQIVFPFIGSPLGIAGRDSFSGLITTKNGIIYVTRGLGSIPLFDFLELRYNCPPEIVVFRPPEIA